MKNIFKKCIGMKGWPCQKLQKLGVGMAVCRDDMLYKDYTTNPIPTSFFISEIILRVMLQDYWEEQFLSQKKRCRDGVSCVVFV